MSNIYLCFGIMSQSNSRFPHPNKANEDGLLAAGGDLNPETLLDAYQQGIFPWYAEGEPILWWSPDPRTVLFPASLYRSKRLKRRLKQMRYQCFMDKDFEAVILACAEPRRDKDGILGGTWILPEMIEAYLRLYVLGYAHAFEVYDGGELIGGLYGVRLGEVFFAESMFSKQRDGSKIAMSYLCEWAIDSGVKWIDCQMFSEHLHSLGAVDISRDEFLKFLDKGTGDKV